MAVLPRDRFARYLKLFSPQPKFLNCVALYGIHWECAGYYPEYWEYTKGIYGVQDIELMEKIWHDAFEEDYSDELSAEKLLWSETPFGI